MNNGRILGGRMSIFHKHLNGYEKGISVYVSLQPAVEIGKYQLFDVAGLSVEQLSENKMSRRFYGGNLASRTAQCSHILRPGLVLKTMETNW